MFFHIDFFIKNRSFIRNLVFTNGCFDLLHPGHLRVLRTMQSFNEEDINSLSLVGINSDRSVSQLKGLSRPVETFDKRCEKVLETGYVDGVLEIDNISSLNTIKTLMPDVLIKGGSTDQIVGQEFVESYGGKVIKTNLIKGYSTTKILKERNN